MSTENTVCTQGDIMQVLLSRKLGAITIVRNSEFLTNMGSLSPWLDHSGFVAGSKNGNQGRKGFLAQTCLKIIRGNSTIGLGPKIIHPVRKPMMCRFRNAWVFIGG
jgi:hypothetical protein